MIRKFTTSFCLLLLVTLLSCNQKEVETVTQTENNDSKEINTVLDQKPSNYLSFIEEVLLGFTHAAIAQHMVQTPYVFIGENEGRINYEAIDSKKVNHFISFDTAQNDVLEVYVYNIDFKNNNEHLVSDYLNEIRVVVEGVFGQDFETGYDTNGNFEIEWTVEAGKVTIISGINFITLEVNGQ